MSVETRLIAEQRKLDALKNRIRAVSYMKTADVRAHLNVSRAVLDAIPFEVLPWVPGAGKERVERRYHPADVAAYPARARRWFDSKRAARETEELAAMREELQERDRARIDDALHGYAA